MREKSFRSFGRCSQYGFLYNTKVAQERLSIYGQPLLSQYIPNVEGALQNSFI